MDIATLYKHKDDLDLLIEAGQISSLTTFPNLPGFEFFLCNQINIQGIRVKNQFSKYKLRIEFDRWHKHPQIYIISPKIEKLVHRNLNGSLCLYDANKYDWNNSMKLSEVIIPQTYLWILYYEAYLKTGKWYGPQ